MVRFDQAYLIRIGLVKPDQTWAAGSDLGRSMICPDHARASGRYAPSATGRLTWSPLRTFGPLRWAGSFYNSHVVRVVTAVELRSTTGQVWSDLIRDDQG